MTSETQIHMYQQIEKAIQYSDAHKDESVRLKDIADHVHLSEFHFHRLFTDWVGTTPDRFFRYIKKEYIKSILEHSTLFEASYESGLSNPSRMHDLFVTFEAMTPGEYKQQGKGLSIQYGFNESPFGQCFLATTAKGILEMRFLDRNDDPLIQLKDEFRFAAFQEDTKRVRKIVGSIFHPQNLNHGKPFHLLLRGTNFQIKVWEALLKLPHGSVASYQDIAQYLGKPTASRAVGQAVGRNHIAYLIPCHRVIERIGNTGNYRWGIYRKKAMLGWEMAMASIGEK